MSSARADERLSPTLGAAVVLCGRFQGAGVGLFRHRPLRAGCRCSQEKVERLIATFPRAEVAAMADDGQITVTCEFCKAVYTVAIGSA